jgi:hypothetical protein
MGSSREIRSHEHEANTQTPEWASLADEWLLSPRSRRPAVAGDHGGVPAPSVLDGGGGVVFASHLEPQQLIAQHTRP